MIIHNSTDGKWQAKCDICQWKTLEIKRENAANKLRNHINIVHKEGLQKIKKQQRPVSRANMPPKIAAP